MKRQNNKQSLFQSFVLFFFLSLIIYGNTLTADFIWDDHHLVQNNVLIRNGSFIPVIFSKDIGAGVGTQFGFYRPVQTLTYLIDYSLWTRDPSGYHFTNILLHALVAWAVYLLMMELFGDPLLARLTGILFAVHPIHTEAVAYIAGRADLLAALFVLWSFLFYIKFFNEHKRIFYLGSCLSYLLALLSRENALILPLLLASWHFVLKKNIDPAVKKNSISPSRFPVPCFVAFILITIFYLVLRLLVLKEGVASWNPHRPLLVQRLPGFFAAVTNYARLLLAPMDQHMEYGQQLFSWNNLHVWGGIVITIGLIVGVWRAQGKEDLIRFSILWFILTLLPHANIFFPINAYMAEHWLYLPSIGFFVVVAHALIELRKNHTWQNIARWMTAVLVILFSALTIIQNRYWQDEIAFCERTLQYNPGSWKICNALGEAYRQRGRIDDAEKMFRRSLTFNVKNPGTYTDLGVIEGMKKNYPEAIHLFTQSISLDPNYATAYYNLAKVYCELKDTQRAIALLTKAIALNPYSCNTHHLLAEAYVLDQKFPLAVQHYEKALKLGCREDLTAIEKLKMLHQ